MEEDNETNSQDTLDLAMPSCDLKLPTNSAKKSTWYSESVLNTSLRLPSLTVTAPPFDNSSEHKFSYFPRKFSFQAFRKLSGSSVSRTSVAKVFGSQCNLFVRLIRECRFSLLFGV